jgi:hypothetical protein
LTVHLILVTTLVHRARVQVADQLAIKLSSFTILCHSSKYKRKSFVIPPFMALVNTMTTSLVVHSGSLRRPLRHRHHIIHASDLQVLGIPTILHQTGNLWDLPSLAWHNDHLLITLVRHLAQSMTCHGIGVGHLLNIIVNGSVNESVEDALSTLHILHSNPIILHVLPALVDTVQWRHLLALHIRPHIHLVHTGTPSPLVAHLTLVHLHHKVLLRVATGDTTLHANRKETHGIMRGNVSCMINVGSQRVSQLRRKAFHMHFLTIWGATRAPLRARDPLLLLMRATANGSQ